MTTSSLVSTSCFSVPRHLLPHHTLNPRYTRFQLRTVGTNLTISNYYRVRSVPVGRELESVGVPTSVPVRVAHELLQAGHRYLDVRTPDEFSAGHASGAINIPYLHRLGSGMAKNPKFMKEVALHFRKDDEIIVGCQSGKRSLMAASDLLLSGFTGLTNIAGGYEAWIQNGLPADS